MNMKRECRKCGALSDASHHRCRDCGAILEGRVHESESEYRKFKQYVRSLTFTGSSDGYRGINTLQ